MQCDQVCVHQHRHGDGSRTMGKVKEGTGGGVVTAFLRREERRAGSMEW